MLLKSHVIYGFNEAGQFKIKFLCLVCYDTVAVTKSLMYIAWTYDPVVNLTYKRVFMLISVDFLFFAGFAIGSVCKCFFIFLYYFYYRTCAFKLTR